MDQVLPIALSLILLKSFADQMFHKEIDDDFGSVIHTALAQSIDNSILDGKNWGTECHNICKWIVFSFL